MPSTIRDLTELTAVAVDDYLLISDTSDVTNRDKRISTSNLQAGVVKPAGTPVAGRVASWASASQIQDGGFAVSDISRLSTAQSMTALKTFTAGISFGDETLSVYDEGTWVPTLQIGASSAGIVYSAQVGTYTRIGRLVFYQVDLRLSSKGTNTGAVAILSFPFAGASNTSISWMRWQNFATAISALLLQSGVGTGFALTYVPAAGTTSATTLLTDTFLTNTSTFLGTGYYFV
jgi:hypothetical protein